MHSTNQFFKLIKQLVAVLANGNAQWMLIAKQEYITEIFLYVAMANVN